MSTGKPPLRLVWSDEFDAPAGTPPDPRWWQAETGAGGWGNGELQRYTADRANAAHDGKGNLVITALKDGDEITSARLVTKGRVEFTYGRLECRLRVPAGRGVWSAVWMLGGNIDRVPWPGCGEIDVMENLGSEPRRAFGTVHCPGHSGAGGISGSVYAAEPLADAFHDFVIDWSPGVISWSLDGVPYTSVSAETLGDAWVFDHPFYILVNLAVGGTLGGEVGSETVFPARLLVDHLRLFAG